jgi:hypothetical protein
LDFCPVFARFQDLDNIISFFANIAQVIKFDQKTGQNTENFSPIESKN